MLGDPVWREAIAPARMWCQQLWRASCEIPGAALSRLEMVQAWHKAKPGAVQSWKDVRGPMGALVLSLCRL
eukprot:6620766-Prorocentrum_lima.AAC.1